MVSVTILFILLPVMCLITGLFTAWGVYIGLKWQIQINQGKEPEKPIDISVISNPFEVIKQNKQEQAAVSILDEWLNGAKEGVK